MSSTPLAEGALAAVDAVARTIFRHYVGAGYDFDSPTSCRLREKAERVAHEVLHDASGVRLMATESA